MINSQNHITHTITIRIYRIVTANTTITTEINILYWFYSSIILFLYTLMGTILSEGKFANGILDFGLCTGPTVIKHVVINVLSNSN